MTAIHDWSVKQIRDAIKRRDVRIEEVARAFVDRIQDLDDRLKSFLILEPEKLLDQASQLDRELAEGSRKLGFLTGIPLAIKDNISTQSVPTTCGSRILENYIPPYDATVIRRLKRDGALILGKTNCDEFSMGSSTENSAFFPTRNPWDLNRVPGGSSGGSAAAVAARLAPAALGSDTGGSIRQPAAFCGIVGFKPTYGRVSRYGLVAFGSSLDQIGPLTRSVRDAATVLQVIAGPDDKDSTSSSHPLDNYVSQLGRPIHDLRIGAPREWLGQGLNSVIRGRIEFALDKLASLGCEIRDVHLPSSEFAIATYYIIAPAEASSNLSRYDGVKFGYRHPDHDSLESMYRQTRSHGFGEEVQRRIMIGTYVLSSGYYDAYYGKASKVRAMIKEDYRRAFEKVDLIVGPTTPSLPFKLGEKIEDPLEMYLGDIFTVNANLAGIPGISLPCGFSNGQPVGLQILGPHFQESRILQAAYALEQEFALTDTAPEF